MRLAANESNVSNTTRACRAPQLTAARARQANTHAHGSYGADAKRTMRLSDEDLAVELPAHVFGSRGNAGSLLPVLQCRHIISKLKIASPNLSRYRTWG